MAESNKIAKSKNFIQLSGTLLETNIELKKNVEVELTNFSDNKKKSKHTVDVYKKVDFKNPALLIECSPKDDDGNIIGTYQIGVDYNNIGFGVASKTFDKDGKFVDNDNFKGIQTVLDKYIIRKDAKEGEEPTKVFVKSASLSPNEYVDKDFNFKSYLPTISTYNVTSSGVPENDICEGNATGIIRAIKDEMYNEEETGRLKIDLYMFDYNGETFPVEFTVEKDLADDFKDLYESGVSCKIYFDILTRQIGAKKVVDNGGFGRRETHTTSGFSVVEYSIFKGEEPFEEDNENFVDKADMKKAMESRDITIEQMIKSKKDKGDNLKEAKKSGLGSRTSKVSDQGFMNIPDGIDEELPF
jgi:hypothetical protein